MKDTWARGGFANAAQHAQDMSRGTPDDQEMSLWAADSALRAEMWEMAAKLSAGVANADPESLMARLILARSLAALGRNRHARRALRQAERLAPGSLICAHHRDLVRAAPDRFSLDTASWRRWIHGKAKLYEGRRIATSDLTVVVLSLGAPPELETAVGSVFGQSIVPEIVMVNSGGGDILARLSQYRDRLRIITTEERLYAGAARNIGIDASTGKFVAFLASDCTATPKSLENRLSRHQAGARAISAYVLPQNPDSVSQNVASLLLHSRRHPMSGNLDEQRYSLSYDRRLFDEFGYFVTGTLIAEDTILNDAIAATVEIEADVDICIHHAYADDPETLLEDIAERSRRRVRHLYFDKLATYQDLKKKVNDGFEVRQQLSMRALEKRREQFTETMISEIVHLLTRALEVERDAAFQEGLVLQKAHNLYRNANTCSDDDFVNVLGNIRQAISLCPSAAIYYQRLAEILLARPAHDTQAQAIAALRKAATLDPNDAHILMLLLDSLIAVGDVDGAMAQFETACLLAPKLPRIWARHAPLPGDAYRPMRVYSLQRAFFIDPFNHSVANTIAENYSHAGNIRAQQARLNLCGALQTQSSLE